MQAEGTGQAKGTGQAEGTGQAKQIDFCWDFVFLFFLFNDA